MVNVVRESLHQFVGGVLVGLAQFVHLLPRFGIQLAGIEVFQNGFGSVVLRKEVVTEAFLATSLQGRTVGTETYKVVLPGHVVGTFGILASAGLHVYFGGCTRLDGIGGCCARSYCDGEDEFTVVGNLIGYLFTFLVQHDNLSRIGQFQQVRNFAHRHFHHLARTFGGQGIGYGDGQCTFIFGT